MIPFFAEDGIENRFFQPPRIIYSPICFRLSSKKREAETGCANFGVTYSFILGDSIVFQSTSMPNPAPSGAVIIGPFMEIGFFTILLIFISARFLYDERELGKVFHTGESSVRVVEFVRIPHR